MQNQIVFLCLVLHCAGGRPLAQNGTGDNLPPTPLDSTPKSDKPKGDSTKKVVTMPIGLAHDFGKIRFEENTSHSLSIMNTTGDPLRVVAVRATSANHLRINMSREQVQPGEVLKIEIKVDARFFVGRKSTQVWLEIEQGERSIVMLMQITAESVKESKP